MKRILVVDDDNTVRSALGDVLLLAGFEVTTAEEREEAEALLATQPYDLVITDLRLGDLSGYSGLQILSEAAHRMGANRVMAMTGYANPLVESAVRDVGSELLKKPFPLSRCVAMCNEKAQQG
ncbi:MAG TPA: response regulator [Candidatus Angelobacter sp.]|nr:response regulator [Candidatus Angelobacter sp.]